MLYMGRVIVEQLMTEDQRVVEARRRHRQRTGARAGRMQRTAALLRPRATSPRPATLLAPEPGPVASGSPLRAAHRPATSG